MSNRNPQVEKVISSSKNSPAEKRARTSTSSSSSCDSPNKTTVQPTKLWKGAKSDHTKSVAIMGLTEDDLTKISALMEGLLDKKLDPMKVHQERVNAHMVKMENFTRAKNIVITGIQEEGEGLDANVEAVNNLCDNLGIRKVLIDDAFRLGKTKGATRPLLVKLALMVDKKLLMGQSKTLRAQKIYLNDDLTQQERKNSGLLRAHFKSLKTTRKDISFSIRNNVMSIWLNNAIIEKYGVEQDTVKRINVLQNA